MAAIGDFRSHLKSVTFANQPLFGHSKSGLIPISGILSLVPALFFVLLSLSHPKVEFVMPCITTLQLVEMVQCKTVQMSMDKLTSCSNNCGSFLFLSWESNALHSIVTSVEVNKLTHNYYKKLAHFCNRKYLLFTLKRT